MNQSKEIQRDPVPRKQKTGNNEEADQHPRGFKGLEVWSFQVESFDSEDRQVPLILNVQKVDSISMMLRHSRQHLQKRFAVGPLYFIAFCIILLGFPCLKSLSFQEKEERELSLVSDSARKLLEESREARRATQPFRFKQRLFDHIKIDQTYRSHF